MNNHNGVTATMSASTPGTSSIAWQTKLTKAYLVNKNAEEVLEFGWRSAITAIHPVNQGIQNWTHLIHDGDVSLGG